ncbi:MAG TPA: hypothetical protein VHK01_05300 [Lacipirellulaceae bacterium]|jgi:prepilin-type processing-associated H-X9-DG protein|nr:hypothetical protein [Lacipirellulaceae bacterium]
MRELLIRYLLGELDATEQRRLEDELRNSPTLERELAHLQACFAAAREVDHSTGEPPCGLARRVTDSVCGDSGSFRAQAADVEAPAGVLGWSLADLTVAGGVVLAVSMLLFPALRDSRDASRRVDCENNLRNIYFAAAKYAEDHGNYFPGIHPQDYAGMFVIRLVSEGYAAPEEMSRLLICKSSRLAELVQNGQVRIQLPRRVNENTIVGPTMAQLCGLASGSYAVRIGYVDADQYYWIREDRGERTPLMSDAPDFQMAEPRSTNHGGHGQNVLYSDGHVEFLASSTLPSGDNVYVNVFGVPAAGRGRNDVVMVSGERTPGVE